MKHFVTAHYESPIGFMEIKGTDEAVHSILFTDVEKTEIQNHAEWTGAVAECIRQLDGYFKGERADFTFSYVMEGTVFQQEVWKALTDIPYGKTATYKDIAVAVGNPKAVRAVGSANSRNKLTIVIPCHRIIGTNGTLTGYAGSLWRKEWLLHHEKQNMLQSSQGQMATSS